MTETTVLCQELAGLEKTMKNVRCGLRPRFELAILEIQAADGLNISRDIIL
jgi:hypothetical protein